MKINWDSEVLSSVSKVVDQLEHLSINKDSIESVADWLAYEEFPMPSSAAVRDDPDDFIRATMFMNTLNFAFTDFDKSIKYEINKTMLGGVVLKYKDSEIDLSVDNKLDGLNSVLTN